MGTVSVNRVNDSNFPSFHNDNKLPSAYNDSKLPPTHNDGNLLPSHNDSNRFLPFHMESYHQDFPPSPVHPETRLLFLVSGSALVILNGT